MQYKKLMQKIIQELNNYKHEIDEMAASYTEEKTKHEEQLQKMVGVYTENYIAEERNSWQPKIDYGKLISLAREVHQKTTTGCFDEIRAEIDEYFQVPVDSGFASTVSAIKAVGATLSNREFELLQGASGGYWGRRLLNELAVSRAKTEQVATLENGKMKRSEQEKWIPYGGVELPDIEKVYDSLQSVKNAVGIALDGYCGSDYQLKDIVFPKDKLAEENHNKIAAEYGVEPPKQAMNAMQVSKMATSLKYFNKDNHSYTAFIEIMDSIESTIPKKKKKEILTEGDKRLIDTIIDSNYQALARDQAMKIAKADKRLAELLALDERYATAVQGVLREVWEHE